MSLEGVVGMGVFCIENADNHIIRLVGRPYTVWGITSMADLRIMGNEHNTNLEWIHP